jgi:hypothetical protein
MSFREKSAWITLLAILLVFALYGLHAPRLSNPGPFELHALFACFAAFLVIEAIAWLVLRLRYPEDSRTPKDERERLIDLRATRIAARCYVVLSFLAIAFALHLTNDNIAVGYYVVLAFVIAEIVNYGARIIYYRRGV